MALELRLNEEDLTLFYEIAISFHAIRDLDEMLRTILDKLKRLFSIQGASIAIHDPENKEFYFIHTVEPNRDPRRLLKMRFPDHLGVAGWVMRHLETVVIQDTSIDYRFFKGIDRQENFLTRSMICAPLKTRKGFIGVLYALNKIEGEFTQKDKRLLEILSGPIAVSIENARLYGELISHVDALKTQNQLLKSQIRSKYNFREIVGSSPAMRRMFAMLERVVDTTTNVLIQGETGTGKELIAKVIHYNGPLKDGPFVAENCAAIPEGLLESELFGHVKGAFTNAVKDKKGLFELADGGTIFLDEIGEMPLHMQAKLLRVLQEKQIRPVGSNQYKKVDVRLIASTNKDLDQEVKKGRFRQDLFYRINVFQITSPPLRKRRSDIPILAEHFLKKFAKKFHKPIPKLSPKATDLLMRFHWPGNVRELENEMERAITMAGGEKIITEQHLSDKIRAIDSEKGSIIVSPSSGTLKEVIKEVEMKMIQEALLNTGGNRSKAARILGITRQGLLNKIVRYQIQM